MNAMDWRVNLLTDKSQFVEDLMNPCNIGRCMNVNLRCLMY